MKFLHVTDVQHEVNDCIIKTKLGLIEISGSWGTPKYSVIEYKEIDGWCPSIEMTFALPSPTSDKNKAIAKYKELGGKVEIIYNFA